MTIFRDIIARRQAEEVLQEAQADLRRRSQERTAELEEAKRHSERADCAKSEFLANRSRGLRTPLNHILGFTELVVKAKFGDLNAVQEEFLTDVLESDHRPLSLIRRKCLKHNTKTALAIDRMAACPDQGVGGTAWGAYLGPQQWPGKGEPFSICSSGLGGPQGAGFTPRAEDRVGSSRLQRWTIPFSKKNVPRRLSISSRHMLEFVSGSFHQPPADAWYTEASSTQFLSSSSLACLGSLR